MLNQLTIIIITYKRYSFLKRLLIFFSSYQSKAQFLVLDSSPNYPEDQELLNLLSQDNVNWKRYDSDIFFAHKIAEAVYAVLCADDDFLIPPALETCINFLIEHPDYSSAHGLYYNHIKGIFEKARKHCFRIGLLYAQGRSSEEQTSTERVMAYLGGKTRSYPMYAVHRASIFRLIWSETKKYVSDEGLSELFPCCLSFSYGKMKILPLFYNSREPNNFNWYTTDTQSEWHNRIYSEDKLKHAIIGLSKHLSKLDRLSLEESESVAQDAFQSYLNGFAQSLKKKSLKANEDLNIFPSWDRVKQKLKNYHNLIIGFLNYLRYQGCHVSIYPKYFDDFKKVRKAVLSINTTFEELNQSRKELAKQVKGKVSVELGQYK